jgi:hypothetical protein
VKRGAGLFALCFGLLCAGRAGAAPGDATRLEYARSDRAGHCPDEVALKNAVVQRLGYDPFFHAARQTIVVEITDVASGLRAQMRLVDEQGIIRGSRELNEQLESCGELVASLALAISIALDPSAALAGPAGVDALADSGPTQKKEAAQGQPESPEALPPEVPSSAATPTVPSHRERSANSPAANGRAGPSPFAARAAWFGALGAAPATALGGRLGGSLRSDWFYFVAEFTDQLPASRAALGAAKVDTSLLHLAVLPCAAWHFLAGCGFFQVRSLRARGLGIDSPVTEYSLYLATGVRLEIMPELARHLRLLVNVDAVKTLTPVTLRLLSGDVWQTPVASGAAGVGLEWQIP